MTDSVQHSGAPPSGANAAVVLPAAHAEPAGPAAERVRVQTMVLLRWLAIGGQLSAVLFVHYGLGFPLPLGLCMAAIAASAWLNVFLSLRYRSTVRLPERTAAILFGFDILQLAALLYLTGGLENPFAVLFLVPVTISATTLSLRSTALLLALAFVCVTFVGLFHEPLPWYPEQTLRLPFAYQVGIWTALLLGLGFLTAYALRIAQESRRMSDALAATQLVLARAQRLSALDGLAAAAAHELGTPLSTIALVSKELQRESPLDPRFKEDLALLHSQAARCRDILSQLTDRPEQDDIVYSRLPLHVLLDEVIQPHRDGDIRFEVGIEKAEPGVPEPTVWRRPEIGYGLGNIIENAADFARTQVRVTARYDAERLVMMVADDGPGFLPEVIDRLGEPYVTTRYRPSGGGRDAPSTDRDNHDEGMGLGFFIAKTLLERTGAAVDVANRADGATGAVVTIDWPRTRVEAAPDGVAEAAQHPDTA